MRHPRIDRSPYHRLTTINAAHCPQSGRLQLAATAVMNAFDITLILATLLCSLVAGFLFAFAVVVMPGLSKLDDRSFIRAFQVMDGIIQRNQPLFMLVWVGSVIALLAAAALGLAQLDVAYRAILGISIGIYLLGVQLPTIAINVPLNNQLQKIDIESTDQANLKAAREAFEPKWNRSNLLRTLLAIATASMLLILVATT